MKKRLKKILLILLVLVVAVCVAAVIFMDRIVKETFNTMAPQVLGTKASLEDVSTHLLMGSVSLKGFVIENPEGYTQKVPLMSVKSMDAGVAPLSLLSDVVVLDKLIMEKPQFSFETKGGVLGVGGSNNIQALMDNIQKYVGTSAEPAKPEEKTAEKPAPMKVIIHKVSITGAQATIILAGSTFTVPLPPIEFEGIGVKEGGVPISTAVMQISGQVLTHLAKAAADGAVKAGGDALKGAGNVGSEAVKGAGDAIKGLFK